jgi:hypothetical protein
MKSTLKELKYAKTEILDDIYCIRQALYELPNGSEASCYLTALVHRKGDALVSIQHKINQCEECGGAIPHG